MLLFCFIHVMFVLNKPNLKGFSKQESSGLGSYLPPYNRSKSATKSSSQAMHKFHVQQINYWWSGKIRFLMVHDNLNLTINSRQRGRRSNKSSKNDDITKRASTNRNFTLKLVRTVEFFRWFHFVQRAKKTIDIYLIRWICFFKNKFCFIKSLPIFWRSKMYHFFLF